MIFCEILQTIIYLSLWEINKERKQCENVLRSYNPNWKSDHTLRVNLISYRRSNILALFSLLVIFQREKDIIVCKKRSYCLSPINSQREKYIIVCQLRKKMRSYFSHIFTPKDFWLHLFLHLCTFKPPIYISPSRHSRDAEYNKGGLSVSK